MKGAVTRYGAFLLASMIFGAIGSLVALVVAAIVAHWSEGVVTGYATVALTFVTATLALYTWLLAQETRNSTLLADRHQQENQMPVVTMVRASARRMVQESSQDSEVFEEVTYYAKATLQNVGYGPAVNVRARTVFYHEGEQYEFPSAQPSDWTGLGTMIAGDETKDADASVRVPAFELHGWRVSKTKSENAVAFKTTIQYQSMLGGDSAQGVVIVKGDARGKVESEEIPPQPVSRL